MPRIALMVPIAEGLNRQESMDLVRRSEEVGFESAWYGESWGYDAFTTLAQVAGATSRIKLGTLIATVFSRTPAMMAQSAASLDVISDGRLILGLGTSGPAVVSNWHGQTWRQPTRRMREYVEIVRMALAGKRVDYDGELFSLKGFRLRNSPLRASVPIMIASLGPRSVEQTGEIADGWLPIFPSLSLLKEGRRLLLQGAQHSGRTMDDFEIAPGILTAVSDDDPRAVRDLARAHVAFYVGGMGTFYADLVARQGFPEETARIALEWSKPGRDGRSAAAAAVTDEMLDAMTLVGTRAHVFNRLHEYADAGVTLPIAMFPFGSNKALIAETLEALGTVATEQV
jgi:F420-dependent oxidoreductase-like protein